MKFHENQPSGGIVYRCGQVCGGGAAYEQAEGHREERRFSEHRQIS